MDNAPIPTPEEKLLAAVNEVFGKGVIKDMMFFSHHPDGSINAVSPMFQEPKGIEDMINRLRRCGYAANYMAEEMFKKTLPKN